MMTGIYRACLGLAMCALGATHASAASVVFDFAASPYGSADSYSYSAGGLSVSVTAGRFAKSGDGYVVDPSRVYRSEHGLGVDSGEWLLDRRMQINGTDLTFEPLVGDEVLVFNFTPPVELRQIRLALVDNGLFGFNPDTMRLLVGDGVSPIQILGGGTENLANFGRGTVNIDLQSVLPEVANLASSQFFVAAVNTGDNFTVRAMQVEGVFALAGTAPTVPAPGAASAGLALLILAGIIARRRHSRA